MVDLVNVTLVLSSLEVGMQHAQRMSITAKVVSGVVILFYFLGFIPGVKENLALIPA